MKKKTKNILAQRKIFLVVVKSNARWRLAEEAILFSLQAIIFEKETSCVDLTLVPLQTPAGTLRLCLQLLLR